MTPRETPISAIRTNAAAVSVAERWIASSRMGATGRFISIDSPKSPLIKRDAQRQYWTRTGSLRPSLTSSALTCSGGAKGPRMRCATLAGRIEVMANTSSETATSTRTISRSRLST